MTWAVAGLLAAAAVAVGWPVDGRGARKRRVLAAATPAGVRARPWRRSAARSDAGARLGSVRARVWVLVGSAVLAAAVWGGPVAGLVGAGYGVTAARAILRRRAQRGRAARRAALLNALGSAAADLRAGLPAATVLAGTTTPAGATPPAAAPAVTVGVAGAAPAAGLVPTPAAAMARVAARDPGDPLLAKVRAAVRLAEQTGAPLAEVLERIEADARGADRAGAAAAAQAAGSRATAWLLAGLPVGGLALGYAIGADPLEVLLRSPLGAACACGALVLQLSGLAWATRIARPPAVAR